ncbi:hypothetical protein C3486_15230 [Streptomyces sp. Ru73]|uniref:hypothetical protein n=1 Tax=Streptomyces sp. Ru73 TaxID=2080748 RepID=UPI000CDE49BB|nr:hypothetical protein [Streptomyces sp. Ru73]POX40145.1 hypothetical protein C3486_15230 [Streptomyces sp. Ru73]
MTPSSGGTAPPPDGRFDAAVRRYLRDRPLATVVALGEGLDTGFWRVDNGQLRWLTVEEPATAALRRMLLPDGPRWRTLTGRPAGPHWPAAVTRPALGVLVLAFGPPPASDALHDLCALCARRLPGATLLLDAPLRRRGVAGGRSRRASLFPPATAPALTEFRF